MTQTADSAEELLKKHAPKIAEQIKQAAQEAWGNEAQFRGNLARGRVFEDFAEHLDLHPQPCDEQTLIRGRADSVYNRFVIEYKAPGVLSAAKDDKKNIAATKQLRDYIEDLAKLEGHKLDRLAGVVIDGCYFIFGRYRGGVWHPDEPLPVTPSSTERFLASLYLLSTEKALTADNLVRDFGENSNVARLAVSALYKALAESRNPKVKVIYDQWRQQFSEVCGYEEGSPRLDVRALAKQYGVQDPKPNAFELFFSIHTYYATFIKLLAVQVVHYYLASKLGTTFLQVAGYTSDRLLQYLQRIERGDFFAQQEIGISNFLEGDFFGWYLEVWDESVDKGIRRVVSELANYSLVTLDADPDQTRDLLKKLYQNVMPKQLRHDLGEYYTPDWLAERLLNQLGYTSEHEHRLHEKRLLDPACGSGTFLVLAIKRFKKHCADRPIREVEVLRRILANIVGFDLNPLAVITARTNYLLALGDLLSVPRDFDVNLPVYTCDSILTPSLVEERVGDQYRMMGPEERIYKFKTVVGDFAIPGSLVSAQYVDALAGLIEECVDSKYSVEDFRKRLLQTLPLVEGKDDLDIHVLEQLYAKIKELDERAINGIWARIIKNAFAPIFCDPFHFVAGNPPWVNWDALPDNYRELTKPIWKRYGLFSLSGWRARLGGGEKDISALMTYVAIDKYLVDGGSIGFVITQTLFKSADAGQGFRRFQLGDGVSFRVLHIDDLVEIRPFSGASNRPAVLIAKKGQSTKYPVSYTYWRRALRASVPEDACLSQVAEVFTKRSQWFAQPISYTNQNAPWITGKRKALSAVFKVIGSSPYQAYMGVHGWAIGIYWINLIAARPDGLLVVSNAADTGKKEVQSIQTALEPDLVYPLLRGLDVHQWQCKSEMYIILAQDPDKRRGWDEDWMKETLPKTFRYFKQFETILRQRSGFLKYYDPCTAPFYSMYNVGPYTLAPFKVVWRYVASDFTCAVASSYPVTGACYKCGIPDTKLVMVPTDSENEAHYLCALLSSSPVKFIVKAYVVNIQIATHILSYVQAPKFNPTDKIHQELSGLSENAHFAANAGDEASTKELEQRIDELAAQIWGLSNEELKEIKESLSELG